MKIFSVLVLGVLLIGCSDIEKIEKVSNPTSYIFNRSEYLLKKDIITAFDNIKYHNLMLSYSGSAFEPIDTLGIFSQSGNHNDFYLSPSRFLLGKSFIYKRGREKLDYVASFHLHLEPMDSNKVRVSVITVKPRVVLGKEFLPRPPHFVRPLKYMNVAPSTIEEYEILLEVGKIINETKMPPIKYPKE